MSAYQVTIQSLEPATHDVLRITTTRPSELSYRSGQAADIAIAKEGWENEKRSFTFTSLPEDNHLEFFIKTYPDHKGVTNELLTIKKGDALNIHDIYGSIRYKDHGVFIAGGAGITPFISIFRDLKSRNAVDGNKLIFANKTRADIILEDEFRSLLGDNFINILSEEKVENYHSGFITEEFISKHLDGDNPYVYLCGPPPMMKALEKHLDNLHISPDHIITETF